MKHQSPTLGTRVLYYGHWEFLQLKSFIHRTDNEIGFVVNTIGKITFGARILSVNFELWIYRRHFYNIIWALDLDTPVAFFIYLQEDEGIYLTQYVYFYHLLFRIYLLGPGGINDLCSTKFHVRRTHISRKACILSEYLIRRRLNS